MRSVWALLAVPVLLVPSACGSDDGSSSDPAPGTETDTSTPEEVPESEPLPEPGVLVELVTSGTIAGVGIGNLVIETSGETEYTGVAGQVEDGALAPDELDQLVELLDETDFEGVPAEPGPEDFCADSVVYTITYRQWRVVADACALPDEIAPVVELLDELLQRFT